MYLVKASLEEEEVVIVLVLFVVVDAIRVIRRILWSIVVEEYIYSSSILPSETDGQTPFQFTTTTVVTLPSPLLFLALTLTTDAVV